MAESCPSAWRWTIKAQLEARRAVGDNGAVQAIIRTVARKGIRFIAEVQEHETGAAPRWIVSPMAPEPVLSSGTGVDHASPAAACNATDDPQQEDFTDRGNWADSDAVDLVRCMRDIVVIPAATRR